MGHVIKLTYSGEPISCEVALQKIFSLTEVAVTHCFKVHNGFKVLVAKPELATPFLSPEGLSKLSAHGFKPIQTPECKAKCTIVAKKIDKTILPRSCDAIREEIARQNAVTVLDVYKPPESRIVKIRVSAPEEAQKLSRGFVMFHTSVPSYNIEPECFIQVDQCLKCYCFNHLKNSCSFGQRCSRCGEDGHFFSTCQKDIKCCNCGGQHIAVSGSCQKRKDIIKTKRQALKQNKNTTYATTAKPLQTSTPTTTKPNTFSSGSTLPPLHIPQTSTFIPNNTPKITTILHTALIAAKYNARRFANILPIMLQKNGLPSIVIPEEIFEDENLYIPEYTQTTTNTEVREATNSSTQPSTSHYHLLPQPLPQRKPKETAQQKTTPKINEHKRKQVSPLNTHQKKDKKDPLLSEPSAALALPQPLGARSRHDDTMLSDSDSVESLQIDLDREVNVGAPSLPVPLGGAVSLLPERGSLPGRRGSVGNWSADSRDFRVSQSQESLPDLDEPSVRSRRSRSRFREQQTPHKVSLRSLDSP